MKKILFCLIITFIMFEAKASQKKSIIENLKNTNNLFFNFEQNINGKIQNGLCTIEYPKKIFCDYNLSNEKVLVSNGKSLVIKTKSSYYLYPIEKTPLNLILDKDFLLQKLLHLEERVIDSKFINFTFYENDNEINIFFDKNTFNLIGWQTLDIYQNLSITYLFSIIKNQKLDKDLFKLPKQN